MYSLQLYRVSRLKSREICNIYIAISHKEGGDVQKIRQDVNIGDNIRKLRIAAGMTQEHVAAKLQLAGCDISRSVYSQIECGTYNIRVSELIALKQLFDTSYDAFFSGLN